MSRPLFKINKITPNIIQQPVSNIINTQQTTIKKTQTQPKIDKYIKKTNNISSHRNITRLSPIDVKFDQTISYNKPLKAYEPKTNNSLTTNIQKNETLKSPWFKLKFLLLGLSLIPILLFQHSSMSGIDASQVTKKISTSRLNV